MVSAKRIVVDAVELRNTFDFVSAGAPLEHSAYICADTGKIYLDVGYSRPGRR
jgi:hypothetical protein